MTKVRIVQLLCPSRHCLLAMAYEAYEGTKDPKVTAMVQDAFEASVKAEVLNPWCGICHSREFHAEDAVTVFSTMGQAQPALEGMQFLQQRVLQAMRARNQ